LEERGEGEEEVRKGESDNRSCRIATGEIAGVVPATNYNAHLGKIHARRSQTAADFYDIFGNYSIFIHLCPILDLYH
jgi:hypothetical protein